MKIQSYVTDARAELAHLRARYDNGAVSPGVYAAIKELERTVVMSRQQRRAAERAQMKSSKGAKPVKHYRDLTIDEPPEAMGGEFLEKANAEVEAMTPEQLKAMLEDEWFMNPGGHFRRRILKRIENAGGMRVVEKPDGSLAVQFAETDNPGVLHVMELLEAVNGAFDDPYDPERTREDYETAQQADLIATLKGDGMFDAGDVVFWATETPGRVNISANAEGRAHYDRACEWGRVPSGFPEGWLGASIVTPDDPIASDELALQLAREACADGMRAIAYAGIDKPVVILHPDTHDQLKESPNWHEMDAQCAADGSYDDITAAIKKSMN